MRHLDWQSVADQIARRRRRHRRWLLAIAAITAAAVTAGYATSSAGAE